MLRLVVVLLFGSLLASTSSTQAASISFPGAGSPKMIVVEIVDTSAQRQKGLMFRDELPKGRGMWFVFQRSEIQNFWMKNVRFPIDIIFIDSNFIIQKIWRSVPPCAKIPCEVYSSIQKVKYTLEVGSGFSDKNGLKENQAVLFRQ